MPSLPPTPAAGRAPRLTTQSFYQNDAWKKALVVAAVSQIPIAMGDVFAGRALLALAKEQPFAKDIALLAACHSLPTLLQAYSSIQATSWGAQSTERVVGGITQHMFGQTDHWVEGRPRMSEHAHRLANDVPWVLGMLVNFAPKRAEASGGLLVQAVMMGLLLEPMIALSLVGTVAVACGCSILCERGDIRELNHSKQMTVPFSDLHTAVRSADTESQPIEGEEPHRLFGRIRNRYWDNVVLGNSYNCTRWNDEFNQINAIHADDSLRREQSKTYYNALSGLFSGLALGGSLAAYAHTLHQRGDQEKLVTVFFPLVARAASIMGQVQNFLGNQQEHTRHERIFARLLRETQANANIKLLDKISPDLCMLDKKGNQFSVSTLLTNPPTQGRITVQDDNGRGKSMFAAAFKQKLGKAAWLLPASHELLFDGQAGSSGETAMANLAALERDLKAYPKVRTIILDEWDANLDTRNRSTASTWIDEMSKRYLILEITHTDTHRAKQEPLS